MPFYTLEELFGYLIKYNHKMGALLEMADVDFLNSMWAALSFDLFQKTPALAVRFFEYARARLIDDTSDSGKISKIAVHFMMHLYWGPALFGDTVARANQKKMFDKELTPLLKSAKKEYLPLLQDLHDLYEFVFLRNSSGPLKRPMFIEYLARCIQLRHTLGTKQTLSNQEMLTWYQIAIGRLTLLGMKDKENPCYPQAQRLIEKASKQCDLLKQKIADAKEEEKQREKKRTAAAFAFFIDPRPTKKAKNDELFDSLVEKSKVIVSSDVESPSATSTGRESPRHKGF